MSGAQANSQRSLHLATPPSRTVSSLRMASSVAFNKIWNHQKPKPLVPLIYSSLRSLPSYRFSLPFIAYLFSRLTDIPLTPLRLRFMTPSIQIKRPINLHALEPATCPSRSARHLFVGRRFSSPAFTMSLSSPTPCFHDCVSLTLSISVSIFAFAPRLSAKPSTTSHPVPSVFLRYIQTGN